MTLLSAGGIFSARLILLFGFSSWDLWANEYGINYFQIN
jgi:hypothetical protein